MIEVDLSLVDSSNTNLSDITPIRFSCKYRHYIFRYCRPIQSNQIDVSVNICAIIGTTEQRCTPQTTILSVYPTGFCYENILVMKTALCHVSMCSSINVRDIIEIYFIAPYILTS